MVVVAYFIYIISYLTYLWPLFSNYSKRKVKIGNFKFRDKNKSPFLKYQKIPRNLHVKVYKNFLFLSFSKWDFNLQV